jgi:hypothetical protein
MRKQHWIVYIMQHQRIKKLILIVLAMLWIFHPCMAATGTQASTANAQHTLSVKIPVKQLSKHKSHSISHRFTKNKKTTGKKSKRRKSTHKLPVIPNDRSALLHTNTAPAVQPKTTPSFISSIGQRLVQFVHGTVSTLRYSAYKLGGTHFDTSRGIYILDCSDYIDHILKEVYPDAYFDLVNASGADKPTTAHFYDFFSGLDNDPNDYWNRVDDVEQLQPGDILVFRYKRSFRRVTSGHVMVVMDKPIRDDDRFLVRVADSAPIGHSQDTRPRRVSGIGIGTLLLKANPKTGQPSAYAWKVGSRWNKNVNIAMARPVTIR